MLIFTFCRILANFYFHFQIADLMERILIRGFEHFQNNWSLKGSIIRKNTVEKYKTKKREMLVILKCVVLVEEVNHTCLLNLMVYHLLLNSIQIVSNIIY